MQNSPNLQTQKLVTRIRRLAILLCGWCCTASAEFVQACPTCKEGLLENGQSGIALARGFELSIYLMLGAPLLILSTLAAVFYFQIRSAQRSGTLPDMAKVIAQAEMRSVTSSR